MALLHFFVAIAIVCAASVTGLAAEPLVAGGLTELPAPPDVGPNALANGGFDGGSTARWQCPRFRRASSSAIAAPSRTATDRPTNPRSSCVDQTNRTYDAHGRLVHSSDDRGLVVCPDAFCVLVWGSDRAPPPPHF